VHILQPALARVYRIGGWKKRSAGECASAFIPTTSKPASRHAPARAEERRELNWRYRLRRPTTKYRWVLENGAASLRSHGAFAGFVASCTDITDRRANRRKRLARQKLESIDCWPAHRRDDFNNLLGSILA